MPGWSSWLSLSTTERYRTSRNGVPFCCPGQPVCGQPKSSRAFGYLAVLSNLDLAREPVGFHLVTAVRGSGRRPRCLPKGRSRNVERDSTGPYEEDPGLKSETWGTLRVARDEPLRRWWECRNYDGLARALRSSPIAGPSSLVQISPPQNTASALAKWSSALVLLP
jgi:hypothetical protein